MKLKGKAEKDFFSWYYKGVKFTDEDIEMFYEDSPTYYVNSIIRWFDLNRIYILFCLNNEVFSYDIKEYFTLSGDLKVWVGFNTNSRNEAEENAIKQANKIYNENQI